MAFEIPFDSYFFLQITNEGTLLQVHKIYVVRKTLMKTIMNVSLCNYNLLGTISRLGNINHVPKN